MLPDNLEMVFASRAEETRYLKAKVERLERDRAELIEALRSMIESHSDMTEGNLYSGAAARVAVKRDARALLSRLGAA